MVGCVLSCSVPRLHAVDLVITDALIGLLAAFVSFIAGLLPVSVLDLPSGSEIAATVGPWIGPVNRFVPVEEIFVGLEIMLNVWLPVAIVYVTVNWIYRHIPFLGGGG